MTDKFIREQHLVGLLMQRLGRSATYEDPNAQAGDETGVDVIALTDTGRIGIQVTEVDVGTVPGRSRGEEKKLARAADSEHGGVYGTWGQNDAGIVLSAIKRCIGRKSLITPADGFSEVWLLISCGVPEAGSIVSSFVFTPPLDVETLNSATCVALRKSKYDHVFLHPVLGVERALYHWSRESGTWTQTVQPEPPGTEGPSFFDVMQDEEWLTDPDGKFARELEKVLQEIREQRAGEPPKDGQ